MPAISKQVGGGNHKTLATAKSAGSDSSSAWDLSSHLKVMLYGESGSGKTTLWATFPGPILALICSGLGRPGELKSIDTPEYRKKITPKIITTPQQFRDELENASQYATVVLDHAGGFSDMVLAFEVLGLTELLKAKYRAAGKGESWSVVSQQEYGQLTMLLKQHFAMLLDAPCNVVIIGHERIFKGKEEAGASSDVIRPNVGINLTPQVAGWLNQACDYILQTFKRPRMAVVKGEGTLEGVETLQRVRGVEYCVRTEPHETFTTKFRKSGGGALPDCLVVGNSVDGVDRKESGYQKIMKAIKG